MALHPQVRAMLDQIEESGLPQLNELPPVDARAQAKLMTELAGAGPEVALEDSLVGVRAAREARRFVIGVGVTGEAHRIVDVAARTLSDPLIAEFVAR